jgi:hypothetical protein
MNLTLLRKQRRIWSDIKNREINLVLRKISALLYEPEAHPRTGQVRETGSIGRKQERTMVA